MRAYCSRTGVDFGAQRMDNSDMKGVRNIKRKRQDAERRVMAGDVQDLTHRGPSAPGPERSYRSLETCQVCGSSRNALGDTPVTLRNTRLKYACSLNPTWRAIARIESLVRRSNSLAW